MSENKVKKIRFLDREPEQILARIERMITNYVYADPWPVDDGDMVELARDTIPTDIREAITTIENFDHRMVEYNPYATFRMMGFSEHRIHFRDNDNTSRYVKTLRRELPATNRKYYATVHTWFTEVVSRKKIASEFLNHARTTLAVCNTPGQVRTMYPALVELLPQRHQDALAKSVRTTRWPSNYHNQTQQEFMETSKKFENMIVLLKMMSDTPQDSTSRFQITVR